MRMLLLFLLFAPKGPHWVKLKDGYRIHWVYVTQYGNAIGDYYQPFKQNVAGSEIPNPFTAQCWEGKPAEFLSEQEAKEFVLRCPT